MGVDIWLLPFIAGVIIAVTMKSIKAGIGTAAFAGTITLFVKATEGNGWYFVGGILCVVTSILCFGDIYATEAREEKFKQWLADCIYRGELLHMKRNADNVSSDSYMAEASKLIDEVTKTLHKYKRETEIVHLVGGLEFKFDDLNSVNASVRDKYKNGRIGNVISSLVDNLSELREHEKGN